MDVNYAYYSSAKGFRVVGGTAAQFLKADGSFDNNTYVTTDTNQNINGQKIFLTSGGNGFNSHALRVQSQDGSNPGITFYKGGVDIATLQFDGTNFKFRNSTDTLSKYVSALGYKKDGSDNSFFLLGGGDHISASNYPTVVQADAKYIPFNGSPFNVNLNAKNINNAGVIESTALKNNSSTLHVKSFVLQTSTIVSSLSIKLSTAGTSNLMGSFTVTMFGYTGQTISFRVSMYKYLNNWFSPSITWVHGDSSKISNIEFYKENDANLHMKVNFVTNFGSYNKTVITDVLATGGDPLHIPDTYTISINPDYSDDLLYTLQQTILNSQIVRDTLGDAPKTPIFLNTSDLNTILTPGFYNQTTDALATLARNYPATNAGSLNVYKSVGTGVIQEYTTYNSVLTYRRSYTGGLWTPWRQLIDSLNIGTIAMFEDNTRPSTSVDLNTYKTQGFYAMGTFTNGPAGANNYGNLLVTQSSTDRFMQIYFDQSNNNVYFRNGVGATPTWGTWKLIADRDWVTSLLTSYVTQSSLNTQLGGYATLNGVQTFSNTITFNQSPIIPAGTLGNHAVNLNQLNASVPSSTEINNWNNKVDRLENVTGVGFDGGTANTPYVKHSNGTNIRVATETWTANSFAALNGDQEFTGINSFTQSPAVPFATHPDDAVPFGQAEEIAQVRINDTFAEVIYKNSANDLTFDFHDYPNVRLATITCKGSNFQNIRIENMPRGATLKIMNGSASLSPIIYFDGGSNATGLGSATWAEFYRDQDSDIFKNSVNGTTII